MKNSSFKKDRKWGQKMGPGPNFPKEIGDGLFVGV
jgi:hypothetical protein